MSYELSEEDVAPLAHADLPPDAAFTLDELTHLHAESHKGDDPDLAFAEALAVEELEAELQDLDLDELDEALALDGLDLDADIPLEDLDVAEIEEFDPMDTPDLLDDYAVSEAALALQPELRSPAYLSDAPLEVAASSAHLRPLLELSVGTEVYDLSNHDDLAAFSHQAQVAFGQTLQPLMDRLHRLWASESEMAELYQQLESLSRERGPVEQIMDMAQQISTAQAQAASQRPASAEVGDALAQVGRLKVVLERYEQILGVLMP
jgi:hypothetical protein